MFRGKRTKRGIKLLPTGICASSIRIFYETNRKICTFRHLKPRDISAGIPLWNVIIGISSPCFAAVPGLTALGGHFYRWQNCSGRNWPHHVPPFIVVVVYNYRIAYFVEVFLYQLAQRENQILSLYLIFSPLLQSTFLQNTSSCPKNLTVNPQVS